MIYKLIRTTELVLAAARIMLLTLLYGRSSFSAHPVGFGPRLSVKIRSGGAVSLGRIVTRNDFSLFCDGGKIKIESGVFFNNSCSINSMSEITIGRDTIFGEGVKIYDHDHALSNDGMPLKEQFSVAPIIIGSNCWFGSNVVILKGVTICDGVVVGSGAVVRSSILEPGVYVGKAIATLTKVGRDKTQTSRVQSNREDI